MWIYRNRTEAGIILHEHLKAQAPPVPVSRIVALPRGGVVVAHEISKRLALPLDVLIARKIGAPGNPEFGIGAITEGGIGSFSPEAIRAFELTDKAIDRLVSEEQKELGRRVELYRGRGARLELKGEDVLLVDDGLATGVTAGVAIKYAKEQAARSITLAIPVAAADTLESLRIEVDRVICPSSPKIFRSVGIWYQDFQQVEDGEVLALLQESEEYRRVAVERDIETPFTGTLRVPPGARGIVLFAHGSGSSRFSPRNRQVAEEFNRQGLGTLLLDLLTPAEARDRNQVFNIPLLSERVREAIVWLQKQSFAKNLPLGIFGASTGAAAALCAAAELGSEISAVVSRGGRPDLADSESLKKVKAPTLLIVGGDDHDVFELNRQASREIPHSRVLVIAGATHLFEETGAMEKVAEAAAHWFQNEFKKGASDEIKSAA
ncbi:MAG: dienelactone hydrolase family protein [Methylotenera sp.]|nr:dienelactone hydrolase family protein [Oligoflexia bacterium]